uniref:Transmembrane protein n=2 Tax=Macrostomum lignano TaxID=282301 RepID=A0A1I8HI58_9PLAT
MHAALQADDLAATEGTSAGSESTGRQRHRQRRHSSGADSHNDADVEGDIGGFALDGVDLAPMSTLELLSGGSGKAAANVGSGGDDIGGGGGDYRGEPDPPTVLIDSEAGPPTAKQRRVARIVMAVAFALLAMCVILIGVTLSMSDRVDEMDKQRRLAEQQEKSAMSPPAAQP